MVKVWKPSAHVPAVHVVEAIPVVETLPVQAVHDPSTTPVTSSMVAAHEVQTRFVVGVQAVDSYSVSEQISHSEHSAPHTSNSHLYLKVWKPGAHVAAVHKSEVLPIQAVQDPSRILATEFVVAAHEVQTRFVVGVQAVDSYSVSEQAEVHSEHPLLVKVWKPAAHVAAEHVAEVLPVPVSGYSEV